MLRGLSLKQQQDHAAVIHASGQTITVNDGATPREIRARVRMLTAEELVNCQEQYHVRVHVAKQDFPTTPPIKGLILVINGVKRGVLAVREAMPNDLSFGWLLECK